MSSRVTKPFKILDAQALSASFQSASMQTGWVDNIGIQLNVTTSANTGQFAIQGSNDNTNWANVTVSPSIPALAGANTVILVNINQWPFEYIRIGFTLGTRTNGSVTAWVKEKSISG